MAMREDTGLLDGIESLWRDGNLYDYTLKVQDEEFRVHKFVLASVSDYFRAMFCGTMTESTNQSVELKEVNAELLSDLIKYIYTGDTTAISDNPNEMLDLAVYFQMPKLMQKCQQILVTKVSVKNCFEFLATFKELSLQEGVDGVTTFIKRNPPKIFEELDNIHITRDGLDILLTVLDMTDHDLFIFIIQWLTAAPVDRMQYVEELTDRVKFHRMTDEDVNFIREEIMADIPEDIRHCGSWKDRYEKAYLYHQLPIHLKIINDSEHTKIETEKSLVAINVEQDSDGLSKFCVFNQHEVDGKKNGWKTCMAIKTPKFKGTVPFVTEVNNFLITCSEFGKYQMWQVFDPRTLTWSKMANTSQPRDKFAMVQHDRHLYVLGGCIASGSKKVLTDTIEEYSFDRGTWSCTKKLPVAVKNHSACVLNGLIYISGGQISTGKGSVLSARVDCFHVTTESSERKTAMLRPTKNHKMSVMMIEGQETIVVIDRNLRVQFYDPLSDQWSTCKFSFIKHDWLGPPEGLDSSPEEVKNLRWGDETQMYVDGNTVFFVKLEGEQQVYCAETQLFDYIPCDDICVKWVMAEEKRDVINEYNGSPFLSFYFLELSPFLPLPLPINVICGPVSFPPDVLEYKPLDFRPGHPW